MSDELMVDYARKQLEALRKDVKKDSSAGHPYHDMVGSRGDGPKDTKGANGGMKLPFSFYNKDPRNANEWKTICYNEWGYLVSEVTPHCPKLYRVIRSYPTLSEVTPHCPKLIHTVRSTQSWLELPLTVRSYPTLSEVTTNCPKPIKAY